MIMDRKILVPDDPVGFSGLYSAAMRSLGFEPCFLEEIVSIVFFVGTLCVRNVLTLLRCSSRLAKISESDLLSFSSTAELYP